MSKHPKIALVGGFGKNETYARSLGEI